MNQENLQFLDYIQSDTCSGVLISNKIKIHTETSDIFFDNVNSRESIYNFFLNQQDEKKKLLKKNLVLAVTMITILQNIYLQFKMLMMINLTY